MWLLLAANGFASLVLLALLGVVVGFTHRWRGLRRNGRDDGGLGSCRRAPDVNPRGPFGGLSLRLRALPELDDRDLARSA